MRNSVKLGIFAIMAVLFASISLVTFKVNAQTNQVHCILVSGVCSPDTTISPNPDCSPGYSPPCAGSTGAACCVSQGTSCSNVTCVFTGASVDTCSSPDYRCEQRAASSQGIDCPNGIIQSCTSSSGSAGNCCMPTSPTEPCTPPDTCQSVGASLCGSRGGQVMDCMDPPGYDECCMVGHGSGTGGSGSTTSAFGPPPTLQDIYDRIALSPEEMAADVYKILLPIIVILGVIAIAAAGYMFMTSQGQPDRVKEASGRLTSAVVGIVFVVLSLVILRVIINTLLK